MDSVRAAAMAELMRAVSTSVSPAGTTSRSVDRWALAEAGSAAVMKVVMAGL
ncbi:MAG: hypothetical protein ACRDVO_15795 [Jiangellaceae bacterium]